MNHKKTSVTPYLLILPAVIYYIVFWIRPVINGFRESFTDGSKHFTLENYLTVFRDPVFLEAFVNTTLFSLISILLQFVLAMAIALVLYKKFRGSKIMLFVAMIPMAIPPTAVAVLWKTGFTTNGWVNSILAALHLIDRPIPWLAMGRWQSLIFLILIDTWTVLPSVMIIILAGLQNFPEEYREAGLVFGATPFQALRQITIPILKPTIITAIILRMIASVQVWSIAVMIFGYGRLPFLVERVAYYVEMVPGMEQSETIAMTYSVIVVVIIMLASVIYLHQSQKKTTMEVKDS